MCVYVLLWILHKAKSTGCLLDSVEAHNDPLHLTTHREQLVDLIF